MSQSVERRPERLDLSRVLRRVTRPQAAEVLDLPPHRRQVGSFRSLHEARQRFSVGLLNDRGEGAPVRHQQERRQRRAQVCEGTAVVIEGERLAGHAGELAGKRVGRVLLARVEHLAPPPAAGGCG